MTLDPQAFATRCLHAGATPHAGTGAFAQPIFQTNGFVFDDQAHGEDVFALKRQGFSYSRGSNPTVTALEKRIADLEGGKAAVAFSSGQAAWLVALLALCGSGDEYVASKHVFGGSLALMNRLAKRLNIQVVWADPTAEGIKKAVTPRTKAIIVEGIVNPTGEVIDIRKIAEVAKSHNLPLLVDSTLATPALMRPIELGADVVIHSASKFLVGNGTAIGGLVIDAGVFPFKNDERYPLVSAPWEDYSDLLLTDQFPAHPYAAACRVLGLRELGPCLAPTLAFFILTGIETLPLRMARHSQNAMEVARWLAGNPKVAAVSYPGLSDHPNHSIATELCPQGLGSIFIVTLRDAQEARNVLDRVQLFSHLVNIGETRSLIAHPASTTHRSLTNEQRQEFGITDATLRLSIGLENAEDLIADLEQALL